MTAVAALYVRRDSVYRDLGCDCYDEGRDARSYSGLLPVVAHPSCRTWSRLRSFSKAPVSERFLALHAIEVVRRVGGVVEHPAGSALWSELGLVPGRRDAFGGLLIHVWQSWWGHRAPKATGFYVVGAEIPPMPFSLGEPGGRVELMGKREREATPLSLAKWLVDLASSCKVRP